METRQKPGTKQSHGEKVVKVIRRASRKKYSAEEKISIVLDGLKSEVSIAELCRRKRIAQSLYYSWSKEFLEGGKKRLAGDIARAATSTEVKDRRREVRDLKEVMAEQALELRLLKKACSGPLGRVRSICLPGNRWRRRRIRYPAPEKLEIIRLVEGSHLLTKRTLVKLGIHRMTFYRLYDRYLSGGSKALEDRSHRPSRVWNRLPEPVREKIKDLALKESDLSPRELAVRFTDTEEYFVSEASVYRILKSGDFITSPAYVVLSAANEFKDKTTRPNQL